ncbi:MAG: DMT family transporter [Bryobacterales bacterium]|nr:DMT family transporter [Bryobacterales bacterium]
MSAWIWLAIVALVFWGITGITQKLSTNYVSSGTSFLWFAAAFPCISAALAPFVAVEWPGDFRLLGLIALGGLLNGLGAWTSFTALERGGKASVVIPLIYIYPLVTVAGAWFLLGERIGARQMTGVFLAIAAVVLLSKEAARE